MNQMARMYAAVAASRPGGGPAGLNAAVIAVPRDPGRPIRRTQSSRGSFCLRYLDPGIYTVVVRDPAAGWVRADDVRVGAGVTDVGELRLKPGGSVRGTVKFRAPCPLPDELTATGPLGVTWRDARKYVLSEYTSLERFEVGGLWPGAWTIRLRSGGMELASAVVIISKTEKVNVVLDARSPDG
jgi:hypothetical protein